MSGIDELISQLWQEGKYHDLGQRDFADTCFTNIESSSQPQCRMRSHANKLQRVRVRLAVDRTKSGLMWQSR